MTGRNKTLDEMEEMDEWQDDTGFKGGEAAYEEKEEGDTVVDLTEDKPTNLDQEEQETP